MNIKIIKGELDQLKDELLVSETAHKNLTGLLNMLEKQLTLTDVSNWVAVEEKLPPKYENVIIRNENNIVSTDQISDDGWVYENLCKLKVTHWMHLPKPPCC